MERAWPRDDDVRHFEDHGFALIRDAVPAAALAAAREALFDVYPTPAEVAAGGDDPRIARYAAAKQLTRDPGSRAFAPDQYLGLREFPTPALALDVVPFHSRLVELAERLLGTRDVRLYQAETYAKYAGVTDYEQPFHIDYTNHALLPPRPSARPVQIQLFLYLSDVTAGCGPPHVVSRRHTADIPMMELVFHAAHRAPRIDPAHEVAAIAPAGSALVYASDVAHRGTAMTEPGAGRFTFNLGYRRADAEWAGGSPWPRRGIAAGFAELVGALSPRQLELLGFPPPGDAYWTERTLSGLAERYPSLDVSAWKEPS